MPGVQERFRSASDGKHMKSKQDVVISILASRDMKDILVEHREDIASLVNAFFATIYVIDKPRNEIYTLYIRGSQLREDRLPIDNRSIVAFVARTGRGVNIADVYDKEELEKTDNSLSHEEEWDKQAGYRTTQTLAIPIKHEGILLGVIQIVNRKGGGKFTAEEQGILEEIAGALSKMLHNHYRISSRRKTRFDYLVNQNLLRESDLESAFTEAHHSHVPVEEILMKRYRISREDIGRSLEDYYLCSFVPFSPLPPPYELLSRIKPEALRREIWVPIGMNTDGRIRILLDDPCNWPKRFMIEKLLQTKSIEYCVATRGDIRLFISYFYDGLNDFEYSEVMEKFPQKPFAPACKAFDTHTKDTIAERLRMLSASPRPMLIRHTAAMCYDMAFPPDRLEYVCPSCGQKTLYAREEQARIETDDDPPSPGRLRAKPYDLVAELEGCRKAVKDIKGIHVELDESQFCRKCRPDVSRPVLLLKVHYGSFCKITPDIRHRDLILLTDFMEGKLRTSGGYDALVDHMKRLEELLGVKMDG